MNDPPAVIYESLDARVYLGDMRELLPTLPPGSFSAIITDPPYERKYWPLYQYVVDQADRLLRPGGYLLMIVPHLFPEPTAQHLTLPEGSVLRYRWPIQMRQTGGNHPRLCNAKRNLRVEGKHIAWWIREPADVDYSEVVDGFDNAPPTKGFKWEQSPTWARYCLGMLPPHSLVLDPMAGHGVLPVEALRMGHEVVACEIEESIAAEMVRRLKQAEADL